MANAISGDLSLVHRLLGLGEPPFKAPGPGVLWDPKNPGDPKALFRELSVSARDAGVVTVTFHFVVAPQAWLAGRLQAWSDLYGGMAAVAFGFLPPGPAVVTDQATLTEIGAGIDGPAYNGTALHVREFLTFYVVPHTLRPTTIPADDRNQV